MKKKLKYFNKIIEIVKRILGFVVLAIFILVPFLHNIFQRVLAEWLWYSAGIIFCVFSVKEGLKVQEDKTTKSEGIAGIFVLVLFFSSVFVFNYYDIDYVWLWVIAGAIVPIAPLVIVSIWKFDLKNNERNQNEKSVAKKNIIKHTCMFWLYDLFYVAVFNNWKFFVFVFGIIIVVIVFFNVTRTFLVGRETFRFLLIFDFLAGVGLSIYLIYVISNVTLQNIVLTITAAVYGGLLTLVGVAWTIRKSDAYRKEDFQRIEDERIEGERKKYRPILNVYLGKVDDKKKVAMQFDQLCVSETTTQLSLERTEQLKCVSRINGFVVKNTDFSSFYIVGISINEIKIPLAYRYIAKEMLASFMLVHIPIYTENSISKISLLIEDLLANIYELPLEFSTEESDIGTQIYIQGNQFSNWLPEKNISNLWKNAN